MVKQRDLSKERIISVAKDIVQQDGFSKLTFGKIAEKLGIRSQSIYNYYDNVDSLIEEMGTSFMNDLYHEMIEGSVGYSGKEAIKRCAKITHDYFESQEALVELLYYVHRYSKDSKFFLATRQVLDLVKRLIGPIKLKFMTSDAFDESFVSSVLGFAVFDVTGLLPKNKKSDQVFDQMIELFLREVAD